MSGLETLTHSIADDVSNWLLCLPSTGNRLTVSIQGMDDHSPVGISTLIVERPQSDVPIGRM